MKTTIHLCLDIAGYLANHNKKRDYERMFRDPASGKSLNADEAKRFLLGQLGEGKRVLPMSECDNFSFQSGCGGHQETPTHDS